MIKYTGAYTQMRTHFLSRESFNRMLETAVRQLERNIELEPGNPGVRFQDIEVTLDGRKPRSVRCLYFVHPVTREAAPFWLHFWRDELRPLDETAAAQTLDNVLDELGW